MPIVINRKFCDNAPACGGIEVCPVGAFYFDKKSKEVKVDETKCINCLKCTLPGICPASCIYYAKTAKEAKKLQEMFDQDPRGADWLWRERYGVARGSVGPFTKVLNSINFDPVLKLDGIKFIDVWHEDFVECRLFSPLYSDILPNDSYIPNVYKLDATRFPNLALQLKVVTFPTLLILDKNNEVWRWEGLIDEKELKMMGVDVENKLESYKRLS